MGLRCRMNGDVIEIWDGEPGEAESDCLAAFHRDWLPQVERQLTEIHKWPKMAHNGTHYPLTHQKRKGT